MQNIEWSSIDWTQTSADIAALLGTGVHAVARARRTFAPHTCRTRADIDWSSVDWSRRTKDIAADLGVDACTVSTARGVYAADTKRKHHRAHAPALALTSEQVVQANRPLADTSALDAYATPGDGDGMTAEVMYGFSGRSAAITSKYPLLSVIQLAHVYPAYADSVAPSGE